MNNQHLNIIPFARQKHSAGRKLFLQQSRYRDLKEQIEMHKVNTLAILSVETLVELITLLKVSFRELEEMINYPLYNVFQISKKSGGPREISAPGGRLKFTQKRLNRFLQCYYFNIKPPETHGFVVNPMPRMEKLCNIVENAKAHVGQKHLLNLDLQDFFPSISANRVKELFLSEYFQYNENLAATMALLVTYKGKLPTGAPTSPVISNFICLELDSELSRFCANKSISYTRYADDLSFSANTPFTKEIIQEIESIVETHRFRVNHQKTRLSGANRKQTVTGLVVNEKVNVDRRLIRKVRAMIHDCKCNGIDNAAFTHFGTMHGFKNDLRLKFRLRVFGYIDFIGQVRGKEDAGYLKLKARAMEMSWE